MEFSSENTGVGCHTLLQGIFSTQGSKPSLLHCKQIVYLVYCLSHKGSPKGLIFNLYIQFICLNIKKKTLKNGQKNEQSFLQRGNAKANRHVKRCSTSLIVREMQIKTTVRYHSCQNDHSQKEQKNTEMLARKPLSFLDQRHCWWRCKLVQPLWKTVYHMTQQFHSW